MITPGTTLDKVLEDALERVDSRYYYIDDLTWFSFPETWGSTALGFGGMGGAAMTTAQTYIVMADLNEAYVYWGGGYGKTVARDTANRMIKARSTTRYE